MIAQTTGIGEEAVDIGGDYPERSGRLKSSNGRVDKWRKTSMSALLQSLFGGWWTWFTGRKEPARADRAVAPEAGELTATPGDAGAAADAEPPGEFTRPFLETLHLKTVPRLEPAVIAVPVDPAVREHTLAALGGLRQIPALQSLAQGFLRAAGRAEVTVDEVVETIEKDPALCVRVLRMANSAFVNPAQPIEDLPTAVQMLGVARVRTVEQALFTLREADRVVAGFDWRHLWIHAYATAAIAEELERHVRTNAEPHLYLAALFHDVGKIVLSTVASDAYRDILVAAWNDRGRLEDLERGRLGVDHREAGAIFAKQNQLPPVVVEAIAHHADPGAAAAHRIDVALVAAANHLSKAHGLGFSGARLDDDAAEFAELPFWPLVREECGFLPDLAAVEQAMREYIATLRSELRGLRAAA
jgi:putative nucleotidyltransferase with HDIG domain